MSPPLRVPLEVLERILSFAFTPLSSPSSSSPISSNDLLAPPLQTSHLLLVSKGVRQLALPLYYSIVSIVQGEDWKSFLDPEKGLLVGEENEKRASFVKELWVNVSEEASTPVDVLHLRDSLQEQERPDRILIELSPTAPLRLNRLLLFLCSSEKHAVAARPRKPDVRDVWWEVVDLQLSDEFWAEGGGFELDESGKEVWGREWEVFLAAGIQRLYRDTDLPSPDELEEQVSSEREDALDLFVDPDLPPRRVEMTLDALGENLFLQLDWLELLSTSDLPFAVLPPTGLDLEKEEDAGTVAASFREDLDHLSFALKHSLMFEDFPRSFWELIGNEDDIVWGEGWTWRSEEGTVVRVKETFGRSEV
ncbi:hypothetical protein BDY24DRAFT_441452 [Mrakia frigida]|uniref:uncharacterized protein n=1 Tax=Mrakia frigida TaxID=29902 RepID=UPI003FCBF12B